MKVVLVHFLLMDFNVTKSEVNEAAIAGVEINPPGKLRWGNSGSTVGVDQGGVCVAFASIVVSINSTLNKALHFLRDLASVCFYHWHQG